MNLLDFCIISFIIQNVKFGGINMHIKNKAEFNKALQIGIACISSYMVSYYMRNILSVTSPEMLSSGLFTKESLGSLSSVYMLLYAIGQLFNGVIGDIIKPKLMITGGMLICGIASISFSFVNNPLFQMVLFALIGFSLSMLRGPLVKTISENTQPNHSRIICTFFSFSSFAGPLIASLISMFVDWRKTFIIAGVISVLIGILAYLVFTSFEKKGRITYTLSKNSNGFKNLFKVFTLKHFSFYLFVVVLTELSSVAVNFWIPTYFTEQLSVPENIAKAIFSAMSLIKSFTPFVSLMIFALFKQKDIKLIRFAFLFGSAFIFGMYFSTTPFLNILCLLMAQIAIGIASSIVWSIYIPSQRESGMVSTINGVLDFTGYLFASITNIIFAHVVGSLGWNSIICIWFCLSTLGVIVSALVKGNK